MEINTGSKSWGYSKKPKHWKKLLNEELNENDPQVRFWLMHQIGATPTTRGLIDETPVSEAIIGAMPMTRGLIETPTTRGLIETPKIISGNNS